MMEVLGRITPAYAGKSQCNTISAKNKKDHPRLCGEKFSFTCFCFNIMGSPPPMRGKVYHKTKGVLSTGITPAYAGKSSADSSHTNRGRDHPRLCGEKTRPAAVHDLMQGSPPPMRGKAAGLSVSPARTGITPAYAGKSLQLWISDRSQEDHPRLCGEKRGTGCLERNHEGSPPPMRGKANALDPVTIATRITPAYAGKSLHQGRPAAYRRDHPRLCGEKG